MAKVTIQMEDSDEGVRVEAYSQPPLEVDGDASPAQVLALQFGKLLEKQNATFFESEDHDN